MSFPYKISLAITSVASKKSCPFEGLTKSGRLLLQNLLRLVSAKDPLLPVWPSKEYLADQMCAHPATIYRALNNLEVLGVITRKDQDRRRNGSYGIGKIALTSKAISLLGLASPLPQLAKGVSDSINAKPVNSTSPTRNLQCIKNQSSSDQPLQNNHASSSSFIKIGFFKIPQSLIGLMTWGELEAKTVLWLMKKASENKQRLEDIVFCMQERLKVLPSATDRVRYLLALCRSLTTDFTAKRGHLMADRQAKAKVVNVGGKPSKPVADHDEVRAGEKYITRAGAELVVERSGDGFIVVGAKRGKRVVAPVNGAFYEAVRTGELTRCVPGQLTNALSESVAA
ncbi:helix-turn-helix domain-containing protein [Vogesella sp. XCS3]|uniref:helix-turn-helix domain-containing protein n=1 Tax=Vogesella sp. XCS3 TaxID=2877939 RepID=UPI001D0B2D79|nr:helix-turn-helix domain-containing protein [Vogesella sp. XCS3]UDM18963.1 helix-turn-helix domain-containing protein [Vogesella sp. XCS3]